jgi:transcription elongation factor
MFNENLDKTSGMSVQKADNCAVLAKTSQGNPNKKFNSNQQRPTNSGGNDRDFGMQMEEEDKFKVGKSIVISVGPLKGYRGVIKSVNKDRIEVRVPQKSCTEWITKGNLVTSSRDNSDMGKTPKRMGMSTYQQPGMSPHSYH